jgi:secreted trypsin-like serine protease
MFKFTKVVAAVGLLTLALATALPAAAITGGQPDGDEHPNVGLVLFYASEGATNARYRCSGTLVAPDVVLTAAHCTDGTVGKTLVTFASVIAEEPPSGLPRAEDDKGSGTSATGYTTIPKGFYGGMAYAHPDYSHFTDLANWNDVGVVRLTKPISAKAIKPAHLAPKNYLDRFAPPLLSSTYFTLVGYGTEVRQPDSGPQKPTPMSYPLLRRNTTSNGQKLTDQIVQMNGNPANDLAGGGTCFGDSGGPSFLDGYLTTVTSYGLTDNCRYLGGYQRVDSPVVQDWLATFGVKP